MQIPSDCTGYRSQTCLSLMYLYACVLNVIIILSTTLNLCQQLKKKKTMFSIDETGNSYYSGTRTTLLKGCPIAYSIIYYLYRHEFFNITIICYFKCSVIVKLSNICIKFIYLKLKIFLN